MLSMSNLTGENFKVLCDNIQVGIVLIDAETHQIVGLNAKAEEMIGCEQSNILGNECHEFICPAKHGQCPITDLGQDIDNAEKILITWRGEKVPILKTVKKIVIDGHNYILDSFVDLTAHKVMQNALKESEKLYRSLFDNMLNGLAYCEIIIDNGRPTDFVYLEVNDAFGELTGLKDVIGRRASEVIPGIQESDPELIEIYGRVALSGKPERFEIYLNALHMWLSISVYSSRKGHFVALFDVITERKNAELSAIRAKEEWERTFNAVPDLIALIDTEHRITRVNKSMADRLGTTPEKAVGCICYEAVHGLTAPPEFCPHQKLLISGKEEFAEVTEKRLGGTFDVSVTPTHDANGMLTGCIHVARDITVRKNVEIALQESEERFRAIFENTKDGILVSNTDGEFLFSNPAMSQMLGYTPEELKALRVQDIHPKKDLPMVMDVFSKVARNEVKTAHELPMQRKDGSVFYVDINGNFINLKGETCLVGVFRDITERKEISEKLRMSEHYLRVLIESMDEGIMVIGTDYRIKDVNKTLVDKFGFTKEKMVGQHCHKISHHRDSPCEPPGDPCPLKGALETGVPFKVVHTHFTDSGGTKVVELIASPIRDEHGEITSIAEVSRDITERRKMEEALKANLNDLERYKKATVDREMKMVELKERIKSLEQKGGVS